MPVLNGDTDGTLGGARLGRADTLRGTDGSIDLLCGDAGGSLEDLARCGDDLLVGGAHSDNQLRGDAVGDLRG